MNDKRDRLEIQDSIIDSEKELNNYFIGTDGDDDDDSIKDIQTGPDGDIYTPFP